jgi:hypothetical protein
LCDDSQQHDLAGLSETYSRIAIIKTIIVGFMKHSPLKNSTLQNIRVFSKKLTESSGILSQLHQVRMHKTNAEVSTSPAVSQ